MFVSAIKEVTKFTRPIHTIARHYSDLLEPGTATLFFINEEGVAVTCKHVLNLLIESDNLNKKYQQFREERNKFAKNGKYRKNLQALEKKYGYKNESYVQIKCTFVNAVTAYTGIKYHVHPTLDLAIVVFENATNHYNSFAKFVSDPQKIQQGRQLCRFGFPFPEFNNFRLNQEADEIEWTNDGNKNSPSFPIDGIITRFAHTPDNKMGMIELSTPGLRGQSGGPLFDSDGLIYGLQSATKHLHLGFDVKEHEVAINGKKQKVSNHPFLHVGWCVHAERITEFLKQHKIKYYTENGVVEAVPAVPAGEVQA